VSVRAPIRAPIRAIIIDIEGTITPIAFVRDVLFPYARAHLAEFLGQKADDPEVAMQVAAVRKLAPGTDALAALLGWMDQDLKIPPLKTLQGMIWQAGYDNGELKGQIYDDVPATLRDWHQHGFALYIYSSGSIPAQRLLLGHSNAGDLTPLLSGHFDTGIGPKREPASYRSIAAQIGIAPQELLFLSDIEAELDAAANACWQTAQLVRENDGTVGSARHPNCAALPEVSLLLEQA